jgi:hypothetical protein
MANNKIADFEFHKPSSKLGAVAGSFLLFRRSRLITRLLSPRFVWPLHPWTGPNLLNWWPLFLRRVSAAGSMSGAAGAITRHSPPGGAINN